MFKTKIYVKLIAVAVLLVLLTVPVVSLAKADNLKDLPEKRDVAVNSVLTVPMEKAIKLSSLADNVYVLDSGFKKVSTSVKLSADGKSIIITPGKPYLNGSAYSLIIRKFVQYVDGKTLASGLRLKFTTVKAAAKLPVVGSSENLRKLLSQFAEQMGYGQNRGVGITSVDMNVTFTKSLEAAVAAPAAEARAADSGSQAASGDYSRTNVQVQGVDEADIVKTDGKYIYYVGNQKITIAKANPADKMEITGIIKFYSKLTPMEIYLDEKFLTVIGTAYNEIPIQDSMLKADDRTKGISVIRYKPYYSNPTVKMIVYDISDKSNIKQLREVELEGNYLSSRKIGSKVYLISNKYMNYYFWNQEVDFNETPSYRDSALGEGFKSIAYDKISYFPDSVEPNYMLVAGVDLENPAAGAHVSTYLGSGQSVYASTENLYVAVTRYKEIKAEPAADRKPAPGGVGIMPIRPVEMQEDTVVYKFGLNEGKITYLKKGEVPGRILNQFSMDESNNTFRIATTKGWVWGNGDNLSKNNLYVLDSGMKTIGKVEDIAPGEQIYSVRFMGNRAYMVTFRTVDPLFVIDLKDAKNPKILGQLKIPGYSDYLHPYDENHIIGFGKDAVEVVHKDQNGKEMWRNAYNLGMKLAVFDVTDVTNPVEKFSEKIGDRGTESDILRNHKALLFSKEKNLLAFPVTLMEVKDKNIKTYDNTPQYGTFTFQGAYVYSIDMEKGFRLKGRITHITEDEYKKSGDYWYDYNKYVERILYIGDNLYTLSKSGIKANDINTLKEKGFVKIP